MGGMTSTEELRREVPMGDLETRRVERVYKTSGSRQGILDMLCGTSGVGKTTGEVFEALVTVKPYLYPTLIAAPLLLSQ